MKIFTGGLIILNLLLTGIVYSHTGADGIVKERMDAMGDMKEKSKQVADMFKGKRELDRNVIVDTADVFIQHGTRMIELFPDTEESRTGYDTEALPSIWDEWDDFKRQATEFVELSKSLKKNASTSEDARELKKAFLHIGNSCSGCHKRFRKS